MNEMNAGEAREKAPIHLWIVGVVSLLWNCMGAFDYSASQLKLEFYMKQFTPEQLEYFYGFPSWAVAFWAFGVWGALAGSVGLLLRKKWAFYAFAVSICGLFVTTIYNFVLTDGAKAMGEGAMAFSVVIWVLALFLLWYSWSQSKKGVLA
jgi:hypothetical protein